MKKTTNKVALIGSGAVGTSFLYQAMAQGIAVEYVVIDIFADVAQGHCMDLEDMLGSRSHPFSVTSGGYDLVKNADVVVITAGRPQKPGETRLEMIADNAKIMATIAEQVKVSGFSGITVIASNPVDVLTTVYQQVTGFDPKKVISSSCSLDTNRLRGELSKIFDIAATEFDAFVLGEHGDSSVSTLQYASVRGIPLQQMYQEKNLSADDLQHIHTRVCNKAYEIINRKKATYYGIGAVLTELVQTILRDEKKIFATGTLLSGQYGQSGVYAGVPCLIGKEGAIASFEFPLSPSELQQFQTSISVLKESTEVALKAI